ncbi:aldose 1-epimerase family protein [Acidisoma silvae]|uniref:Aldose 1-epimerase family protein n=1 Tax=Acidisoma silvae TaxID=2802396 RepID=A0A964DXK4_9PROT|nr:aldose 1-epimerase family protein [Acidisoma silvae]MCB8874380.1 aldose 1-epimerase family protein [Acidisoma silvae]
MTGTNDDSHILSGDIKATILAQGAELVSLKGPDGHEYMWQAGPAWPRHSPVLFPNVGRLTDDTYSHDGQSYRLTQHGFARDRRFTWVSRSATHCTLRLVDDAESRAIYPYAFRLDLTYELRGSALTLRYTLTNTGDVTLPAAIGAHPAFVWPILPGVAKEDHELRFSRDEKAPIHGVKGGLLTDAVHPSPVNDRVIKLNTDLFAEDALVFTDLESRSVRFSGRGTPALEVSWEGFEQLGIWTKPGGSGDFLCIEPWHGYASPEGFTGDLTEKPGMMLLPPRTERELQWTVRLIADKTV